MITKTYSLRRRLLALICVPIILAGLVIGGLSIAFTYHEIGEVYDAQLVGSAKLLLQLTVHELEEPEEKGLALGPEQDKLSHLYEKKTSFRIWKDGRLVTESASAGVFASKPSPPGFSLLDVDADGSYWRIFEYVDQDSGVTIEVAEDNDVRTELIEQILGSLFIPAIIFVPLIMLFVWVGTTRSLKPMVFLAQQVNNRNAEDLTSLETSHIPEEVTPFISALNRLFKRVNETLQREREFTDNAAHELRTPLAAMKTQTQVLMKNGESSAEHQEGLGNLLNSIDRATQMVAQLLSFARLQNVHDPIETVNLSVLAASAVRELSLGALSRAQMIEAEIVPDLYLNGYSGALTVLVRNLVDNAIKYTPQGGHIVVSLKPFGQNVVLEVKDTGPGIAPEHGDKIFDRFYRINKSQGTGSGLGLSMVRWIAEMHNAQIQLDNNPPHGLIIRVVFP